MGWKYCKVFQIGKKNNILGMGLFSPNHPALSLRMARWGYWKFDKSSRLFSNKVIFLNKHLESARKESKTQLIIPIGTIR